jgi:hypothetical protein
VNARTSEHEALDRLSRIHGPEELRVVLLALITPHSNAEAYIAWSIETQSWPDAALLRQEVTQVSEPARVPCLEALLERMKRLPRPARRALLESARRVMAAGGRLRPLDRLHWLVMRHRLAEHAPSAMSPAADVPHAAAAWPAPSLASVAAITAYLARLVPGEESNRGLAWYALAMACIAPESEVPACRAPDGDGLAHALDDVRTLSWMLRPVLMRAWVESALAIGAGGLEREAADALRLIARLIDSPLPPDLARSFTEPAWTVVSRVNV